MTGFTHITGGIASLWIFAFLPNFITHPILLVVAALGGLFPDLDGSGSLIQNFRIGSRRIGFRPFKLLALLFQPWGHRGMLHSILAGTILSSGAAILLNQYAIPIEFSLAFAFGFMSHLLLDSFTAYGVYWFWPARIPIHLTPKRFAVRVKSPIDYLIGITLLIPIAILLATYSDFLPSLILK